MEDSKSWKLDNYIEQHKEDTKLGDCLSCENGHIEEIKINGKKPFYGCCEYKSGCTYTLHLPRQYLGKTKSKSNVKKILSKKKTT